jgi:hypothetical protein
MTDVAVDSAGTVYGISAHNAYVLDLSGSAPHCKKTVPLATPSTFYGLSMAPAGVIGSGETLVAANTAGQLWAIDLTSATLTQHGSFGTVPANDGRGHPYTYVGGAFELSGDVVFGVGSSGSPVGFVTIRDCPSPPSGAGCNTTDTLAELDIAAMAAPGAGSIVKSIVGQIVKASSCADPSAAAYGSFYGLAMRPSSALGFGHDGRIVTIDFTTGEGCALVSGGTAFGGAGVTDGVVTSAP